MRINRLKKIQETLKISKEGRNLEESLNLLKTKVFWKDKSRFIDEVKRFDMNKIDQTLQKLKEMEILVKTQSKINSEVILKNFLVSLCNIQSNASLKA